MQTTIVAQIQALREMTIAELRDKYRDVMGEEPRGYNRERLWRRIAWQIQANEEGGLSERALQRAAELAKDAAVRFRPLPTGTVPPSERTVVHAFSPVRDSRIPPPGTVLTREYRGQTLRVTVLDRGFEYDGKIFKSLTAIAEAVSGTHWNGLGFFGLSGKKT